MWPYYSRTNCQKVRDAYHTTLKASSTASFDVPPNYTYRLQPMTCIHYNKHNISPAWFSSFTVMHVCTMYANIIWLCMIKARIRWCTCRVENILTLGKLLSLCLFPPPFYFAFDISNLLSHIQNNFKLWARSPRNGNHFSSIIYLDWTPQCGARFARPIIWLLHQCVPVRQQEFFQLIHCNRVDL